MALGLAAATGLFSVAALLLGWGADFDLLVRVLPGSVAMVPSTALCIGLISLAVLLITHAPARPAAPRIAAGLAAVTALANIALQAFAGYGFGRILLGDVMAPGDAMATATALSVCLSAVCALRLTVQPGSGLLRTACATLGLLSALLVVTGYSFDSTSFREVFLYSAMALTTAICFATLFLALLLLRPRHTWMGLVLAEGAGSKTARRLFPFAIVLPYLLCLAASELTDAEVFTANLRLSLLAVLIVTICCAALLRSAALENRDERRLRASFRETERVSAERAVLLREAYHRVRNILSQINAMLRLEVRRQNDPALRRSLETMTERVDNLATVHRILIAARDPAHLDLPEFVEALAKELPVALGPEAKRVPLSVEADPGTMHLDRAVPLGRLVSEMLTEALRQAVAAGGNETVRLHVRNTAEAVTIEVCGPGPEPSTDRTEESAEQVMDLLVQELGGTMEKYGEPHGRRLVRLPGELVALARAA